MNPNDTSINTSIDTSIDNSIDATELARRCRADGEFAMAARHWNGGFRFEIGDRQLSLDIRDGMVSAAANPAPAAARTAPAMVVLSGADAVWDALLAPKPAPGYVDIASAQRRGLSRAGDELTYWQYLPALQRAVELLRPTESTRAESTPAESSESTSNPRRTESTSNRAIPGSRSAAFDSPVGRYVHLELGGYDHRIYFEEAGQGIPLLLQHTAGSHGTQWRHLFEYPEITDHFRLIAYDLPFHGKSVPPVGDQWWTRRYQLTGPFLRSVPVGLAAALQLDRPVFMGCSVGGLLALDLALHHPDVFRAVISLEGALRVGGDLDALIGFWHPGVSNETKARMMEGLIAPDSPMAYRKETAQTYAAGWPAAFLGDLNYYCVDYDLRERAAEIDTSKVAVHILNGTYDYSATPAHGRDAAAAITGATFTEMEGMGHFPMSEDPERFVTYLLPVLAQLRGEVQAPKPPL
ncbi:MAG: alpha/beta fold hydrolase [Acidimicrobiales bacterium]